MVACPPEHIPNRLGDLIDFVESASLPPLLRAVVCLMQVLQIHPFTDGNGRLAQFLYWKIATSAGGERSELLRLPKRLWANGALELNRWALQLRRDNDWKPGLHRSLAVLTNTTSGNDSD